MEYFKNKDLILDAFFKAGFVNFSKNKFRATDRDMTSKEVLALVSYPKGLKGAIDPEDYLNMVESPQESKDAVFSVLKGIKKESNMETPEMPEGLSINRNKYDSLSLFKVSGNHCHDPGYLKSSGFSLLAMGSNGKIIDWRTGLSPDAVLARKGIERKELPFIKEIPEVAIKFNPLTAESTFMAEDDVFDSQEEMLFVNTAIPSYWMKQDEYKNLKPRVGKFIGTLIEHLFPREEEREFVLDWCHHLIFKRNGTVLCLAGDRGTGKTTFVEILSMLVGEQYSETVNEAVLKDKFNSQFHNKRFIIFEEVSLQSPEAVSKIKAWCNSKLTIEKKGSDAFTADNWASMAFLMNDIANLGINAQERRFSIPEVATDNLMTVISAKDISWFKSGMESRQTEVLSEIAQFGLFLKDRKPKYSEQYALKGAYFFRVADTAMKEWETVLREYVKNNGKPGITIPINKIFPAVNDGSRFPTRRSTIEAWLSEYRYLGLYKIGKVKDLEKSKISEDSDSLEPGSNVDLGPTPGRTRRSYGIEPFADFLDACWPKKKARAEDLL